MESSRLLEQLRKKKKKIPQPKLAKIATLLLVIYAAYLAAVTIWKFVDIPSNVGSISAPVIKSSNSSSKTSTNVQPLLAINLFGKHEVTQAKPEPKPVTSVAPKTRLNLTLTGIVADNSSKVSKTSVAIIESRNIQNTYGIDDQIEGTSAKVNQILLDRVILSVGPRFETLMLEGIEYSTSIPGSSSELNDNIDIEAIETEGPKRPQRPTKRQESKQDRDAKAELYDRRDDDELADSLREQREQLFEDPKQLLDYIQITPHRVEGELLGYKLKPGSDPSLFNQAGLETNDLATDINGYDLTDMQQALSLMSELKELTEANITVIRDGSPIQIILAL